MNQASFFIKNKALFGGYPNHNQIIELQKEGVVWFIDLTSQNEKNIKVYSHLVNNWINYPIKDGHVPENNKKFMVFLCLLQIILESLKPDEKIYLHCRGGHGRSSLVISCFFSMVLNIPPFDSIKLAKEYHDLRPNLNQKWLLRWPLSLKQRKFVESFFGTVLFHTNFKDHRIKDVVTKIEFLRYMIILNIYLHKHPFMLEILLNSGLKTIKGEGITSKILQELRYYILNAIAKKLFKFD